MNFVISWQVRDMRFGEVAARINGFSTPFGGVSWVPPTVDIDVARQVIAHVESKRVLFSTYSNEVPEHCVASVLDIRSFLTEQISKGGISDKLDQTLRLMRRQCLRFLDRVGATETSVDANAHGRTLFREPRWHMHDYWFGEALGELRGGMALQICTIAVGYRLDVEDDLASILPPPED
ncbi:DUF6650 family protein [Humibacter sp.]|uniref:DUF6650 family protein n=1 Tax=Humibacter sp. TaxID=1940291 RepID=UPI003F81E946